MAIDPSNSATLYAGTYANGVFKSTNGGVSWTPANNGLTDLTVYSLTIAPANTSTLYVGTKFGGVFISTDGGGSWQQDNSGLTVGYIHALTIDPYNPTQLYAGGLGGVFQFIGVNPTPDASANCLFNWAEGNYSNLFAPSGSQTAFWRSYAYRYYWATNAYVGVSSADNHAYYLGPDGNMQDEGPVSYWLNLAGCQ